MEPKYLPFLRFFTVQTAEGVPGKSETAISDTSKPCLKTRMVELGPRPQEVYSWGVSSLTRSAMWHEKGHQDMRCLFIFLINLQDLVLTKSLNSRTLIYFCSAAQAKALTYSCQNAILTFLINKFNLFPFITNSCLHYKMLDKNINI